MRQRVVVVVVAALLMGYGVYRLDDMPVDVLPEFSRPHVEIQTEALGLSAVVAVVNSGECVVAGMSSPGARCEQRAG